MIWGNVRQTETSSPAPGNSWTVQECAHQRLLRVSGFDSFETELFPSSITKGQTKLRFQFKVTRRKVLVHINTFCSYTEQIRTWICVPLWVSKTVPKISGTKCSRAGGKNKERCKKPYPLTRDAYVQLHRGAPPCPSVRQAQVGSAVRSRLKFSAVPPQADTFSNTQVTSRIAMQCYTIKLPTQDSSMRWRLHSHSTLSALSWQPSHSPRRSPTQQWSRSRYAQLLRTYDTV